MAVAFDLKVQKLVDLHLPELLKLGPYNVQHRHFQEIVAPDRHKRLMFQPESAVQIFAHKARACSVLCDDKPRTKKIRKIYF